MVFGVAPLAGFVGLELHEFNLFSTRANAATYNGTCGDNLTWILDENFELVISGMGEMLEWKSSADVPWYGMRSRIRTVTIDNGVTNIGSYAFSDCTNLESANIPESVLYTGKHAFFNTKIYNTETNWEDDVLYVGDHLVSAKTSISGEYIIKDSTKSITLQAVTYNLPEGAKVKWEVNGDGVSIRVSARGKNCKVTSTSNGNVIIRAYIVDSKGNTIAGKDGNPISDYEYLYSEVNLWLIIINFIKQLFGKTDTVSQMFKVIY